QHPTSVMGPLVEPAGGKLEHALTTLEPGERWLVEPRRLDSTGRLWSPGVKEGVTPGSPFHLTEYFGPVLGIMTAPTLDDAIALQNAVPYGLTAGLFSLDADELATWLERVEAGNLYVNRGITGAIVRRQPFGGWKRSSVGAGTKAGGPNYLVGLSDWTSEPATRSAAPSPSVARLLDAARSAGVDGLDRAFGSDAAAWRDEFGTVRDVSQLGVERNVLRYLPTPVLVRHAGGPVADLLRVAGAAIAARSDAVVSTPDELPRTVAAALRAGGLRPVVEDAAAWRRRVAALDGGRIRLVGGAASEGYDATGGRPDVAVYAQPVTEAGRIELLPFLREQAISITAHRFGTPDHLFDGVLVETPAQSLPQ
ncbi:aldehyde dehydrogenase family protein, partial [Jatrophihabitans endophyticus]|uniref:aldehyde dehydrogenase family protein n=1 Tax=Jatrophihabitans endophyticus TaxID=1206085 RepID=UPI0019ED34E9